MSHPQITSSNCDVVFAVLPFADIGRPAIGVSLLQAALAPLSFSSRVCYFNLDFAALIGAEDYTRVANALPPEAMIGEWVFADYVFGHQLPPASDYVAKVLGRFPNADTFAATALTARRQVHDFVERCAQAIFDQNPQVVGFTTTFHQTCACLAVAKRLKERAHTPLIIFGGANCEGEMGVQLLQAFSWIDSVCTGEGDVAFPTFMQQLRAGEQQSIPGILRRGEIEVTKSRNLADMDALPIPIYHDYFDVLSQSPIREHIHPDLVIETSRGCWWGEKNHCTFCGLNGATMAFRSKSPERVLYELDYLTTTYELNRVECVDNILDLKYLRTLFPQMIERGMHVSLFFETKANLRRQQLVVLHAAGVQAIQPGLESLSNDVLRRMRKGCTALQNIQLLRWCAELGMSVAWNILFGFPGEQPEEYSRMAHIIPLLTHLQPPASCALFRLDRFSPHFAEPAAFEITRVRPNHAYYYVFPLARRELARLAYYFEFDYADQCDPYAYTGALQREVHRWWAWFQVPPQQRPTLDLRIEGDELVVHDTRSIATAPEHRLDGIAAEIYALCDVAHTPAGIARALASDVDEMIVRAILDRLLAAKLMVEIENQYLSLALFRDRSFTYGSEKVHDDIPLATTTSAAPLLRAG